MRGSAACPLLLLAGLVLLAGCDQVDPYTRPGEWHPLGANAANLRAMIADPRDLDQGQGAAFGEGDIAAAAVARLRDDKVKRLPSSSVSTVRLNDTGAPDSGGADATPNATVAAPAAAASAGQ